MVSVKAFDYNLLPTIDSGIHCPVPLFEKQKKSGRGWCGPSATFVSAILDRDTMAVRVGMTIMMQEIIPDMHTARVLIG